MIANIIVGTACGPRFKPRYDENPPLYFQHVDNIPIIAVMRVGANAPVLIGQPFDVQAIPGGPVQLFKVAVEIENVLQNQTRLKISESQKSEVFYFNSAIPHGPRSSAMGLYSKSAFRVLMLLREDAGHLRIFTDFSGCCYSDVHSGSHLGFRPKPQQPLSEAVIDLLLTRGRDATDVDMVRAVFAGAPSAISLRYSETALLRLAASETQVVRVAACLEYRDVIAEAMLGGGEKKESAMSEQFGIPAPELKRWLAEFEQNGPATSWWAHSLDRGLLPAVSPMPKHPLAGMALCVDDHALGVPSLQPQPSLEPDQVNNRH